MIYCRHKKDNTGFLKCSFLSFDDVLKSMDKNIDDIKFVNICNYKNCSLNEVNSYFTNLKDVLRCCNAIVKNHRGYIKVVEDWLGINSIILYDMDLEKDMCEYCLEIYFNE